MPGRATASEMGRRKALKLLAAGLAATKAGCLAAPGEELKPYVRQPEDMVLGRPYYYATSMLVDGFATGLVVESHEGRPTKIEGNPLHPASLGATSALHQASIYGLYDPHRAQSVTKRGSPATWQEVLGQLRLDDKGPLWLVLPPDSSPLHAELLRRLLAARPDTKLVRVDPAGHGNLYAGARLLFQRPWELLPDFTKARVVAAFDADFLATGAMSVRWAHDFAERRRPASPQASMSRLYVAEPMPTPTGSLADHHLALPAGDVPALLIQLSELLRRKGRALPELPASAQTAARERVQSLQASQWLELLASDLHAKDGESLVVVGNRQPPPCHALALLLNMSLQNAGRTLSFAEPTLLAPQASASLSDLVEAIDQKIVGTLVILDVNPVYASAPELDLSRRIGRVPLSVHVSLYRNETSSACTYHAPLSHYLESWGDARALDGTVSLLQPLVKPLVDSKMSSEVLALLAGDPHPSGRLLLRDFWRTQLGDQDFEARWSAALSKGQVEGSAWPLQTPSPTGTEALMAALAQWRPAPTAELELNLARSPTLHDGDFANYAWLQELPHPITKLTWSNAACLAPETAKALGIETGQVLELAVGNRKLRAPALIVPGHALRCVTLELGYGRSATSEPIADGVGANAYRLVPKDGSLVLTNLTLRATRERAELAITQDHQDERGRNLAHAATLHTWQDKAQEWAEAERAPIASMHHFEAKAALSWAMSIDTSLCSGCGACVIACQAENNIPSVGAEEVRRGREMHWLRIDTYRLETEPELPFALVHQPMLCQHCEHAPCEYVCPVFATGHSPDGLNEMVYNRCVGTRFCSNNCPYKVRRFNWFNYTSDSGSLELQRNPEVTVRERGVMEKCTYCVQRIRRAEAQARMEKRSIAPGEVRTACQQACPTRAIQFGALEHADTPMVKWRAESRTYSALRELGTRPRTKYLTKIYNPTPGDST